MFKTRSRKARYEDDKIKKIPAIPALANLPPNLLQQLGYFAPLSLKDAQKKSLMSRVDSKFLLNIKTLQAVLPMLQDEYYAVEINGERAPGYLTFYYDTPNFLAYYAHHNGIFHRYKVRNRLYTSTYDNFLEVKHKNNKGRTIKTRIPVEGMPFEGIPFGDREKAFLSTLLPNEYRGLEFKLSVFYFRLTLVSKHSEERLTIDFDLGFGDAVENRTFLERTVIVELKQPSRALDSVFKRVARSNKLRTSGFSKYVIGCSLVHRQLRRNNLKPTLLNVNKLERSGEDQYDRN